MRFYCCLAAVIATLLAGCAGPQLSHNTYKYCFDFNKEVTRLDSLNPSIRKMVVKDGRSEVHTTTVHWSDEMADFIEADINRPVFRDRYLLDSVVSNDTVTYIYTAGDSALSVGHAEYKYYNGRFIKANIEFKKDNKLNKLTKTLSYDISDGYCILIREHTALSEEETTVIAGRFLENYPNGFWQMSLDLEKGDVLPFDVELFTSGDSLKANIFNDKEVLDWVVSRFDEDSLVMSSPVFGTTIRAQLFPNKTLRGIWENSNRAEPYSIALSGAYGKYTRFREARSSETIPDVSGRWQVKFSPGTDDEYPAVGLFKQNGRFVSGTFLTETGDFRYLSGNAFNDKLLLSAFDGSHAFLFNGRMHGADTLEGMFYSGTHWQEPWVAVRNDSAHLEDPYRLTQLKDGYKTLSFSFPDLDSNIVSSNDARFKGKVLLVDIMGSWCPNCMDETAVLSDLYKKYHTQGLEIVTLAFENSNDFELNRKHLKAYAKHFGADYPILIAGFNDKEEVEEKLPMLNHIMSFPTTVYIDRSAKARRIFTGFYGPGTGLYYQTYLEESKQFIEQLLNEHPD